MRLFSRSSDTESKNKNPEDEPLLEDSVQSEDEMESRAPIEPDDSAQGRALSPLQRKSQDRQRELDILMSRVSELDKAFDQISSFSALSTTNIRSLAEYISASKVEVESELRLERENADLNSKVNSLVDEVESLTSKLHDADATVHALRNRGVETRKALETARNNIVAMREAEKKYRDDLNKRGEELTLTNSKFNELTSEHEALRSKYSILRERAENLDTDMEAYAKQEFQMAHNLSEVNALLDKEAKKSKALTSELESLKREFNGIKNENIDYKSRLDVAMDELEYQKSRLQDELRKHDDELYSLNAEIENVTSRKRFADQSLKEALAENQLLKSRNRETNSRLIEVQHQLESAQKASDSERAELKSVNSKLRDLNLRYNSALSELNHEKAQNKKYTDSIEGIVSENKKLKKYEIMYGSAEAQIQELKLQLREYQSIIEEDGRLNDSRLYLDVGEKLDDDGGKEVQSTDSQDKKDDDGSSVVVKLR